MSSPVIRIEGLSKRYVLRAPGIGAVQYDTLREALVRRLAAPFRRTPDHQSSSAPAQRSSLRDFWALKDVSFEIQPGEVVGIIGRNGAGKSTLLKILSRITEPTAGRISIRGRLASLLEVGTGFHPELTGRENIFLNGVILGMSRSEVTKRFDEIVAFAEVEKFLDTPVKHYSSGMYVRLAFAVAAHLEPEVLIVDEVLAVGDAAFQKKCLGKMDDLSKSGGRTVLLVSHNMAAVSGLCPRVLLLNSGQVQAFGPAQSVIESYLADGVTSSGEANFDRGHASAANPHVRLLGARTISRKQITAEVAMDQPLRVEVDFDVLSAGSHFSVHLQLFDRMGTCVCVLCSPGDHFPLGPHRQSVEFPANFFNDGSYSFNVLLLRNDAEVAVKLDHLLAITVQETTARTESWNGVFWGSIRPKFDWQSHSLTGSAPS